MPELVIGLGICPLCEHQIKTKDDATITGTDTDSDFDDESKDVYDDCTCCDTLMLYEFTVREVKPADADEPEYLQTSGDVNDLPIDFSYFDKDGEHPISITDITSERG